MPVITKREARDAAEGVGPAFIGGRAAGQERWRRPRVDWGPSAKVASVATTNIRFRKDTNMRILDLNTLTLASGGHDSDDGQYCLMEAVAAFSGEPWGDQPACVSPVLITFGIGLNDRLPDDRRQELKPLIPLLPGTASDGLDEARSYLALDWLIRTYTPAWLDLAGLTEEATALRDLRRIADLVAAQAAGPVVRQAQEKARAARAAAWDAAWDAAGDAAWDAARDAARAAAWDAARAAAWDAARAAARDAAWDAARDAAGDAAWDAARDAAWDAARAAARDAAWDAARAAARDAAWDAARAAAWDALKPTVVQLQASAIELFRVMIRPGEDGESS